MEVSFRHGIALVDDDDWERAIQWGTWRSDKQMRMTHDPAVYVRGRPWTDYNAAPVRLHRFILGMESWAADPRHVDHINGNGLDNRRENLRIVTALKNIVNSGSRGGSSRFKGVSFETQTGRWKAQIMVDGRNRSLGRFHDEVEAAAAYNLAAFEAWGEHATLNQLG